MEWINGGVCAPLGFKANGIHAGIRKNKSKKDLALIISDTPCSAASVYTTNLVKGAPIIVTKKNLKKGIAQAIICNSGNANTCNADGIEIAEGMCALVEEYTNIKRDKVIVASTGVIGQPLSLEPIKSSFKELYQGLGDKSNDANLAIMTTDTIVKEVALKFTINGTECVMGGIAKGSGMIAPNMATMLVFITTDAAITPKMLRKALKSDVEDTFNMVSVDGDTSTNDMLSILANGRAGNKLIDDKGADYDSFLYALNMVTSSLCKLLAKDGEGATKLIECKVEGAKSVKNARMVAKSVIKSSLFKAAMFGADANWGRVLCAIGYSGAKVDIDKVDVSFISSSGIIDVCRKGSGIDFSEEHAKVVLSENEITVIIKLNMGDAEATAWGCDLTYDYVKINGDYRT